MLVELLGRLSFSLVVSGSRIDVDVFEVLYAFVLSLNQDFQTCLGSIKAPGNARLSVPAFAEGAQEHPRR